MTSPAPEPMWAHAIRSFRHTGPDGDAALASAHPDLAQTIGALNPGERRVVAGVPVARQDDGNWGRLVATATSHRRGSWCSPSAAPLADDNALNWLRQATTR